MSDPTGSRSIRVVADVGGTNTRFALFDPASAEFHALAVYDNADFSSLEQVFGQWLDALGEPPPEVCCLAVAAPPSEDQVVMFNLDWSFSCTAMAKRFGFRHILRLNDFEATAYALPHLARDDRVELHRGKGGNYGRLATVGPGTGLGGAFLDRSTGVPRSFACEPGHIGLAPGDELELEIFRILLAHHTNVYAELLVSGPGLVRLHRVLGEITGRRAEKLAPADISSRAANGEDGLCVLALDTFCALLGSVCGDFLLANGSYGGLYLAGGIAPQLISYLSGSTFHQRLVSKGAMGDILDAVPVNVITTDQPGLVGAAHAPLG